MLKELKKKRKLKKNKQSLKYQTALEQNLAKAEKITDLQDIVIRLQNDLIKQKDENLKLKEAQIERLKNER